METNRGGGAVKDEFSVDVVVAYEISTALKSFVEYVVEVKRGQQTYTSAKRYSEFRHLHEKLQRKFKNSIRWPAFPPRTFFKPKSAEVEKRRVMFGKYLQDVLGYHFVASNDDLRNFLQLHLFEQASKRSTFMESDGSGEEEEVEELKSRSEKRDKLRRNSYAVSLKPLPNLPKHVEFLSVPVTPGSEITGFDQEFFYIEEKSEHQYLNLTFDASLAEHNVSKNRYCNILAPDSTRVRLKETPGVIGSDYINANFINGVAPRTEKAYICTQGPLSNTLTDFWQMIWEQAVSVIVMLTKEVEAGRIKCECYWPDATQPLVCGNYSVELESSEQTQEISIRYFTFLNTKNGEKRRIVQFQYTGWPDQGIPESRASFLNLIDFVNQENIGRRPVVVHCSAGVGRTGTFCAVHCVMEKMRSDINQVVDCPAIFSIVDTVLTFRIQRPGMIQTKEQFMFCYFAVLDAIDKLRYHKLEDLLS